MDRVNLLRTMRWNQTHSSLNLQAVHISITLTARRRIVHKSPSEPLKTESEQIILKDNKEADKGACILATRLFVGPGCAKSRWC